MILLLFFFQQLFFHPHGGCRFNNMGSPYILWMGATWIGCMTAIIIFRKIPTIKPLAYIGRHSMIYYVMHWLPLYFASHTIRYFYPEIDQYALTAILIAFVFLTLALFTWKDKWIPAWWLGER